MKKRFIGGLTVLGLGLALVFPALEAEAHCDTTNGPTYVALQAALEEKNFDHIAYWVDEEDEVKLQEVYDLAIEVLEKSEDEATDELAERYLFENFVRLHRASEGAPYTGVTDNPVDEAVAAADQAIELESLDPLIESGFVNEENQAHVEEVFAELLETKEFDIADTEAGRAYVENYVVFTHLFEEGHEDHGEEDAHGHDEDAHHEEEDGH